MPPRTRRTRQALRKVERLRGSLRWLSISRECGRCRRDPRLRERCRRDTGRSRMRRAKGTEDLEPMVLHATPVTRHVVEPVEAIEMIDGKMGDRIRVREAHVDRDTTAPFLVRLGPAHESDAYPFGAKMKLDRIAADVSGRRTRHLDAVAFVVIGPKDAVSAAHGAIACGDRVRHAFEGPLDRAAVAGAVDHVHCTGEASGFPFSTTQTRLRWAGVD